MVRGDYSNVSWDIRLVDVVVVSLEIVGTTTIYLPLRKHKFF